MWARWVLGGLAVGFGWAVLDLAGAAYERGSTYPAGSSLRADGEGTKLLHDSLRKLPGWRVERHFESHAKIPAEAGAVLFLRQSPEKLQGLAETVERVARGGGRVVVGVPAEESVVKKRQAGKRMAEDWLGLRWEARTESKEEGRWSRETTQWRYAAQDAAWRLGEGYAERELGEGSVVVLDGGELQSEALRQRRDGARLLRLLGPGRRVTFVESALGVTERGGMVSLMRRVGWGPAVLLLLAAAALYGWRSLTPLLPEREDSVTREEPGGGAAAMAQLLRKHVGTGELLATCRQEWSRAEGLLPRWQRERKWAVGTGGVVEEYRRMQELVREKPGI